MRKKKTTSKRVWLVIRTPKRVWLIFESPPSKKRATSKRVWLVIRTPKHTWLIFESPSPSHMKKHGRRLYVGTQKGIFLVFSIPSCVTVVRLLIILFVLYSMIDMPWTREIYPYLTKPSILAGVLFGIVFNKFYFRSILNQAVSNTTCFLPSFLKIKRTVKSIFLYCFSIAVWVLIVLSIISRINTLLDASPSTSIYTPVIRLEKRRCRHKGSLICHLKYRQPYFYEVQVEAYKYKFHTTKILYDQLHVGSAVELKIHQGFLNSPWISTEIEA